MQWVRYPNHRMAKAADYIRSDARHWTLEGDSQYNPQLFSTDQAIRRLELHCMRYGTLIKKSTSGHRKTFFMDAKKEVGYCSGEKTSFVFTEITSGNYHGRPISVLALRKLGVKP